MPPILNIDEPNSLYQYEPLEGQHEWPARKANRACAVQRPKISVFHKQ